LPEAVLFTISLIINELNVYNNIKSPAVTIRQRTYWQPKSAFLQIHKTLNFN
jgi:hypothetical protein